VPIKQRLIFSSISNFTYSNCHLDDIIKDGLEVVRTRIDQIEDNINNEEKIYFNPSKTAQNGINFVTQGLIDDILRCSHNETIRDIFRLLYVLGNKDYTSPLIIKDFFENLFKKGLTFSNNKFLTNR
jgi:hypothetical protein